MRSSSMVGACRTGIAVWFVVAGLVYAAAGASAASCGGSGAPSPNVGSGDNILNGVAAVSACHAWAVGHYYNGTAYLTLVERWNGKAWKVQKSPSPGGSTNILDYNALYGVAGVSSSDAWAVGDYFNGTADRTLVEHWNGKAWKVQKSPTPAATSTNTLQAVAAVSARDVWAVGYYYNGTADRTLVEHWNGKAWKVQKSPDPGGTANPNELYGVAAVSARDVWAVGSYSNGPKQRTLTMHWNGKAWKVQKSPNPSTTGYDEFNAVAAVSSSDVWGVGESDTSAAEATLTARWNGKAWRLHKSPNPSTTDDEFYGVAALSSTDAWTVGYYNNGTTDRTLTVHWNGNAWKVHKSPNPPASSSDVFSGVAAVSSRDAWAVGYYYNGTADRTLIERWNGKAWNG